jgi:hypothetical protein
MTPATPDAVFDCVVLLQAAVKRFPDLLILNPVALIRELSATGTS